MKSAFTSSETLRVTQPGLSSPRACGGSPHCCPLHQAVHDPNHFIFTREHSLAPQYLSWDLKLRLVFRALRHLSFCIPWCGCPDKWPQRAFEEEEVSSQLAPQLPAPQMSPTESWVTQGRLLTSQKCYFPGRQKGVNLLPPTWSGPPPRGCWGGGGG